VGSKHDAGVTEVDVLYVTDFRFPGGNSSLAAREIGLLVQEGYRVGLLNLTSPVNSAQASIREPFLRIANDPLVSVVSTMDAVRAGLTLVRHPSVLQYPEQIRSGVETDRVIVIVNHAPFTRDGFGSIYDISAVEASASVIFGQEPSFAPESGLIRDGLKGLLPPSMVLPSNWPGVVATAPDLPDTVADPRPIIGRHSRDHVAKWPETAKLLLESYPEGAGYEVRILGGAETPRRILGAIPENWTVHEFGAMPPSEFLRDVPFWVYQHNSSLTESFGMAAAEAMAAGCVVILPHYMKGSFGEGAVYGAPADVTRIVDGFVNDPVSFHKQRKRGISFARKFFSEDAFSSRVRSLLGERA